MKIKLLLLPLLLLLLSTALAQETGSVTGNVVIRNNRQMLDGAKVTINTPLPLTVYTDRGVFEIKDIPAGTWDIEVEADDFTSVRMSVRVVDGQVTNLNFVTLAPEFRGENIDEFFLDVDNESGDNAQDLPVSLSASRDVYDNIAAYNFGAMRFRNRGYEGAKSSVYFNGIYLSDAMNGFTPFSLWGGLNEATRNQEQTSGLMYADYGVGSINGTTNVNATASQLRKGWRGSVVNASGQYLFRGMLTYASGENENGWSYAFSLSTRQGGNFWEYATPYNSWAYFGSIEKRLGAHRLALTAFGSPTTRGVAAAATQEVYDLVGSNYYNPNWGFQGGIDGARRNARERNYHEPVLVLNYSWDINANNKLLAAFAFRFGFNGYSALDWYDAPDPRPDYYRYLPSYYADPATPSNADPVKAGYLTESWKSDWNARQINWDRLYNVNYNSYFSVDDGQLEGVSTTTRRSKYVIEERHADQRDINGKLQWNTVLNNNMRFNVGFNYRWNRTEYFKIMKDLLSGDAWLNIDQFAERDFGNNDAIQNDLNNPNRLIRKGDKYGYDYYGHLYNETLWGLFRYNYNEWEAYAAVEGGHTRFWREGLYRKGLFPNNSFGNSEKKNFWTYTAKAGVSYRISNAHRIWANVAMMEEAPYFQYALMSPRSRNDFLPGLTTTKIMSADLNYALSFPFMRARITGYYTTIKDQTNVITFYDDLQRSFSNFAMRGINELHTGTEVGVEVPLVYDITFKGALSYGYYIYTSNPYVTQTMDNNASVIVENEKVYWDKFKIAGTPQTALSFGLDYRSRRNLFLNVDLSYFNATYISMNPLRRTDFALQGMGDDIETVRAMRKQEKFDPAFTLNASIGKFWYLGRYMLGFNCNVKNILNTTNIKTGGFEQMRNAENRDEGYYQPFDSKYYYMFGATYYLNIYFRF
ncbi:MAG: TonB-dependent receptor [Bacteroidales bacterium]|nr:TonB-dependent receptor [Bacteroidales bacterium]